MPLQKYALIFISAGLTVVFQFFVVAPQTATAAPVGCYRELPNGSYVESDCLQGNPAPQCELTTTNANGSSSTNRVDCGTIEVISATPNADAQELKLSFNGDAELDNEVYCGKGDKQVRISFDIGCLGNAYEGDEYNPVLDMMFALLRFVSTGVGLIVIGSIIWAGIQYSASRGNPQMTEAAIKRVANSMIALLLYVFSFAILNFLVPGGLFI